MKELVEEFLEKGYLVSPEFIEELGSLDKEEIFNRLDSINGKKPLILDKESQKINQQIGNTANIDWFKLEKLKALQEKGKNGEDYKDFLEALNEKITKKQEVLAPVNIAVVDEYKEDEKKREMQDFVKYFKHRYNALREVLQERIELRNPISLHRISGRNKGEQLSIIGLVSDKRVNKTGSMTITIEDPTGTTNVLIRKDKPELYNLAKNLVLDEVIGVNGSYGDNILFANNILFPDIPFTKELKKAKDEAYAVFISDLHVGSKMFLPEDFQKFIDWINGKYGSKEQIEVSKKVKYLFIIGDLVDGIGVYPEQDKELVIKDIKEQYEKCAEYLSQIREDLKIIICAGNHDALRISEPQPKLHQKFAESLYKLKNVLMVTNPSMVNIHASEGFPGFDILLYHGYSFDYYVSNVDSIRVNGGYDRADLIMKFLLQKRHLAPTHGSTLYIPDTKKDALIINKIPDFFVTGHIHKANVGSYKNITTICCSCWQSKTTFQEKVGHNPEPSRVPVVNLKTREVKVFKFCN